MRLWNDKQPGCHDFFWFNPCLTILIISMPFVFELWTLNFEGAEEKQNSRKQMLWKKYENQVGDSIANLNTVVQKF